MQIWKNAHMFIFFNSVIYVVLQSISKLFRKITREYQMS